MLVDLSTEINALLSYLEKGKSDLVYKDTIKLLEEYPDEVRLLKILGACEYKRDNQLHAASAFERALNIEPQDEETICNLCLVYLNLGKLEKARNKLTSFQTKFQSTNRTIIMLSEISLLDGKFNTARFLLYDSLRKKKPEVQIFLLLGYIFIKMKKPYRAFEIYKIALQFFPENIDIFNNIISIKNSQKKFKIAQDYAEKCLSIYPESCSANFNLAVTLFEQEKFDKSIPLFKKCTSLNFNFEKGYIFHCKALIHTEKINDAIKVLNLGLTYNTTSQLIMAEIGECYLLKKDFKNAKTILEKCINEYQDDPSILNNYGVACLETNAISLAIPSFRQALKLGGKSITTYSNLFFAKRLACDWSKEEQVNFSKVFKQEMEWPLSPFPLLLFEDCPENQLTRSEQHNFFLEKKYRRPDKNYVFKKKMQNQRLNLAYVSADFHEFPGMHLMRGMFDFHDRKKFKIYAISHGPMTYDSMQKYIIEKVDEFIDVRSLSDTQIIDLMRSKNIDIAINRNGFTRNNRSSLFVNRIAPIQVNFLGYPGTLGMSEIDYIIADKVVIPEKFRKFYSEKIIYMPSCYQPNDLRRFNGRREVDRAKYGLPTDKIIFVCFNNSYKISFEEFSIWMEILLEVPDSALWLLESNSVTEENILRYALQSGVDKDRIVFAQRVSQKEHLARHSLADIFLDTFNYNAHTTASDALLMGIPIVTLKGRQFSARVAASLLSSLNLNELITNSKKEYKNLIITLASNPYVLNLFKNKLQENLYKSELFDAKSFTRNFEFGLLVAYEKFSRGESIDDIFV